MEKVAVDEDTLEDFAERNRSHNLAKINQLFNTNNPKIEQIVDSALRDNDNNNALKNILVTSVADIVKDVVKPQIIQQQVTITEDLSITQCGRLRDAFPNFDINFVSANKNSHSYAAASRKLETLTCMNLIKYNKEYNYSQNEHFRNVSENFVYFIDIGGNYPFYYENDYKYIHCCSPILDRHDACRNANRKNRIFNYNNNNILSCNQKEMLSEIYRSDVGETTNFICRNKAQDCKIKCTNAIAIHSVYDISVKDMVDTMDKRGIDTLVGTFVFSPRMLEQKQGVIDGVDMHWKYSNDGKEISFSFKNDSSFVYTHKTSTYFQWVTMNSVMSTNGQSECYLELLENRDGIQFFKLVRSQDIVNGSLGHKVWFGNDEKYKVSFLTYDLDLMLSIGSNPTKLAGDFLKIKGLTSEEKHILNKICKKNLPLKSDVNDSIDMSNAYVKRELDHRRVPLYKRTFYVDKELVDAALSFAIGASESKFKPGEVFNFLRSHSSRMIIGKDVIRKYGIIQAVELLDLAYAVYMFVYDLKFRQGKSLQHIIESLNYNRNLQEVGWFKKFFVSAPIIKNTGCINRFVYNILKEEVNVSLFITEPEQYVEFTTSIKISDTMRTVLMYLKELLTSKEIDLPKKVKSKITNFNRYYSLVNVEEGTLAFKTFIPSKLKEDLIPNFDLVIKELINDAFSVDITDADINAILKHNKIKRIEKVSECKAIDCNENFRNIDATEIGYEAICMHEELVDNCAEVIVDYSDDNCNNRILNLRSKIGTFSNAAYTRVKSKYITVRPFNTNRNNAYYKIREILDNLRICVEGSNVLDVSAAPGGISWYLLEKYANLDIVHYKEGKIQLRKDLEKYVVNSNNGDLTSNLNVDEIVKELRVKYSCRYHNLIVADGCLMTDAIDMEDANSELVLGELNLILKVLVHGGNCIIKLFGMNSTKLFEAISSFVSYFQDYFFIKPASSNPISSEIYLVCKAFLGVNPSVYNNCEDRLYHIRNCINYNIIRNLEQFLVDIRNQVLNIECERKTFVYESTDHFVFYSMEIIDNNDSIFNNLNLTGGYESHYFPYTIIDKQLIRIRNSTSLKNLIDKDVRFFMYQQHDTDGLQDILYSDQPINKEHLVQAWLEFSYNVENKIEFFGDVEAVKIDYILESSCQFLDDNVSVIKKDCDFIDEKICLGKVVEKRIDKIPIDLYIVDGWRRVLKSRKFDINVNYVYFHLSDKELDIKTFNAFLDMTEDGIDILAIYKPLCIELNITKFNINNYKPKMSNTQVIIRDFANMYLLDFPETSINIKEVIFIECNNYNTKMKAIKKNDDSIVTKREKLLLNRLSVFNRSSLIEFKRENKFKKKKKFLNFSVAHDDVLSDSKSIKRVFDMDSVRNCDVDIPIQEDKSTENVLIAELNNERGSTCGKEILQKENSNQVNKEDKHINSTELDKTALYFVQTPISNEVTDVEYIGSADSNQESTEPLQKDKFLIHKIKGDGDCAYSCISNGVHEGSSIRSLIKDKYKSYIKNFNECDEKALLEELNNWGGYTSIYVASRMFNIDYSIYMDNINNKVTDIRNDKAMQHISFILREKHYDLMIPTCSIHDTSLFFDYFSTIDVNSLCKLVFSESGTNNIALANCNFNDYLLNSSVVVYNPYYIISECGLACVNRQVKNFLDNFKGNVVYILLYKKNMINTINYILDNINRSAQWYFRILVGVKSYTLLKLQFSVNSRKGNVGIHVIEDCISKMELHTNSCTDCKNKNIGETWVIDTHLICNCKKNKGKTMEQVKHQEQLKGMYNLVILPSSNSEIKERITNKGNNTLLYVDMKGDEIYDEENTIRLLERNFKALGMIGKNIKLGLNIFKQFNAIKLFSYLQDKFHHIKYFIKDKKPIQVGYERFSMNSILEKDNPSVILNSMMEIKEIWKVTSTEILHNFDNMYNVVYALDFDFKKWNCKDKSVGVIDLMFHKWVIKPMSGNLEYEVAYYRDFVDGQGRFVGTESFLKSGKIIVTDHVPENVRKSRYVFVNRSTVIMNENRLYNAVKNHCLSVNSVNFHIKLVEGVPGSGKTENLIRKHKFLDEHEYIVTTTKEAVIDLRRRVLNRYTSMDINKINDILNNKKINMTKQEAIAVNYAKNHYRTSDSFLIHYNNFKVKTLYADEAFMRHAGEIMWLAYISKCSQLLIFGDKAQIPYYNREGVDCKYSSITNRLQVDELELLTVSHRCPIDVAYTLSNLRSRGTKVYNFDMTTTSKVVTSMDASVIKNVSEIKEKIRTKTCLTFLQGEKFELKELGIKHVYTVSEYQGKQDEEIVLIRINQKKIDTFEDEKQMLVAISRHLKVFHYYTTVMDTLFGLIKDTVNTDPNSFKKHKLDIEGGYSQANYLRRYKSIDTRQYPDYETVIIGDYTTDCNRIDTALNNIVANHGYSEFRAIKPILVPTYDCYSYISDASRVGRKPDEWYEKKSDVFVETAMVNDCINVLQFYTDIIKPGCSTSSNKYDYYLFENSDTYLSARDFRIDTCYKVFNVRDCLTSSIRTPCPRNIPNTQKYILKAFSERNGGVPQLSGRAVPEFSVSEYINIFKHAYISDFNLYSSFEQHPIGVNSEALAEWLSTQNSQIMKIIKSDVEKTIYNKYINEYNYILKRLPKPVLDDNPESTFNSPQAIACQEKLVNALFCPIVKEMKQRLLSVMKKDKFIYCDMSPEDFEDILNYRFPPELMKDYKYRYEIDFTKYDKSQGLLALELEVELMVKLGFPKELVPIWMYMHTSSALYNLSVRLKAWITTQRRSGESITFLGNTMHTMTVLAVVLFLIINDCVLMVSGDDSYIFSRKPIEIEKVLIQFANIFNLEAKLLKYKYPYFCSKFLIPINTKRWVFVPDVWKLLIKMGRNDLVDKIHAEEYRISLCDTTYRLGDESIYHELNNAMRDRYSLDFSLDILFAAIYWVVRDKQQYNRLYYLADNDVLIKYASTDSRPKLEI